MDERKARSLVEDLVTMRVDAPNGLFQPAAFRSPPEAARRTFLTGLPCVLLVLQAACAFASGREGEAFVQPVLWTVAIVLVTFVTLSIGGAFLGALKASRSGESILKGGGRGLLKGMVAFLLVAAVSVAALTILGGLWIAFSFVYVYLFPLTPS